MAGIACNSNYGDEWVEENEEIAITRALDSAGAQDISVGKVIIDFKLPPDASIRQLRDCLGAIGPVTNVTRYGNGAIKPEELVTWLSHGSGSLRITLGRK